jgi:hypothetical protein
VSQPAWPRLGSLLLLGFLVTRLGSAPVLPPSQKDIAEWVRKLGARDFASRERAQKKLWQAGQLAEEALRQAAKSDDAEVRRRANEILNKFKWGIYPNTPKKIVGLIEEYQAGNKIRKLAIVKQLFDEGSAGCSALLKVAAAEEDAGLRRELFQHVSREAGRVIPGVLADKNYATLESLLELTLSGDRETALPHYAAYFLLRGKLDDRIAHFKKLAEGGKEVEGVHEALFYLYRAKGAVAEAVAVAEKVKRRDLAAALLAERGRWKELAGKEAPEAARLVERLAYRAAYHRLAGNTKEFEEAVAALRKHAEGQSADSQETWYTAKALFLNDRPAEAMALLTRDRGVLTRLEILIAQWKFTEALQLADKVKADTPQEADAVDVLRGRIFYFLGDKDKGRKLFAELGEKLKPTSAQSWADKLVQVEFRLGLKEEAFEHCARALVANPSIFAQTRLLKKILPGQEETAQVWWMVLRKKQASEEAAVSMKTLRRLLAGKIKGKELKTLIEDAEADARGQRPEEAGRRLEALAEVALAAGDETLAKVYFVKASDAASSPKALVRWGDFLAGKKRWREAAEAYAAGWQKDRRQPLALFLRGWALTQMGQKKEGEAFMEQSHWLPLGDDKLRPEFARELLVRGQPEHSRRERDLMLKVCPPGSFQAGEAHRLNGLTAMREKKYLEAAEQHEQAVLRVLRAYVNFLDTSAYVGVPHVIHRMRAAGLVAAGKVAEAQKEIDFCLTVLPGNPEIGSQLVPQLEKAGHKKEADALYGRLRSFKEKLCKEYPRSAALHNSVAWMSATCRRDLEEAQTHAEQAVQGEPKIPGYRDTLAEVLFQRGKKAQAIEHIKKCIELDPKREYYRKQLKRFEAGDPRTEVPLENR